MNDLHVTSTGPSDGAEDELDARLRRSGRQIVALATTMTLTEDCSSFARSGAVRIRPWRRPLALAVVAASVAAVGGATFLVLEDDGRTGVVPADGAPVPVAVRSGRFGTEIPLREVDDGDGLVTTRRLEAVGTGRTVTIRDGDQATTQVTLSDGTQQTTAAQQCAELDTGEGFCGDAPNVLTLMLGDRTDSGAALAYGVPADAVVVTFESGAERHWQRPIAGFAVFAYTGSSDADASVSAIGADGAVLATSASSNSKRSAAELAAAPRVSAPTGVRLPTVLRAALPAGYRSYEFERTEGVSGLLGYGGPFLAQTLYAGTSADNSRTAVVVTVARSDVAAVGGRFRRLYPSWTVHELTTTDAVHAEGVGAVVVAQPTTPAAELDEIVASVGPGRAAPTAADQRTSLDGPLAFDSVRAPSIVAGLDALLTDVVATVSAEGRSVPLLAQRDDLGGVQFRIGVTADTYTGVEFDPRHPDPGPIVAATSGFGPMVWAVAPSTRAVRFTLDDGTTVDGQVIDVTAVAAIALVYVDVPDGRAITDVMVG